MRIITVPETGREFFLEDDYSITDENGTLWTENGYFTLNDTGDTFGPGHPNTPPIIKAIRKARKDDLEHPPV